MSGPSWTVQALELRPSSFDRKFGTGREGRIERKEEDGLGDFFRRPEALHGNHADRLLPNLGGHVFIGKHFVEDRRVDGTGVTALTRISRGANAAASVRANDRSAALAAPYVD
jgi:hypothetical protein